MCYLCAEDRLRSGVEGADGALLAGTILGMGKCVRGLDECAGYFVHALLYIMYMEQNNARQTIERCPIRNVLARVGDKWSLLVMLTLKMERVMRFGELQRRLTDISQKSLSQTLRTLEEDGFVHRTVYPEVPPRVEYALTDRAMSFLVPAESLVQWAGEHMQDILADRARAASR